MVMDDDFDDEDEVRGHGAARRAHFNDYDLKQQFDSNSSIR